MGGSSCSCCAYLGKGCHQHRALCSDGLSSLYSHDTPLIPCLGGACPHPSPCASPPRTLQGCELCGGADVRGGGSVGRTPDPVLTLQPAV